MTTEVNVELPESLRSHRMRATASESVLQGTVHWSAVQSLWFTGMSAAAIAGGVAWFSWGALLLFAGSTGIVLLFGHSLGSHRKLIHDSFQCPLWLEYVLVYLGVQVGLAGPLGLLRQHELRDYAQRLPDCHPYLRHGRGFWVDAWWQLHCELRLVNPPHIRIEERIASDRFYQFLERTWMWQHLPVALLFYLWGGWGFVACGVCARVAAGVFGHWLIGYFAHNHGEMHHEVRDAAVQGHNVRWTSLLTMGECWHNNHHAFPGSARLGIQRGEWDPGWWLLLALRRFGLVWSLRLPEDLPFRSELVRRNEHGQHRKSPWADVFQAILRPVELRGELVWPGRYLGAAGLLCLLGPDTPSRLDRGASRMAFKLPDRTILGLPALCVAASRRDILPVRVAAILLAPIAVLFEHSRRHR